jgi:hypothetical protein
MLSRTYRALRAVMGCVLTLAVFAVTVTAVDQFTLSVLV